MPRERPKKWQKDKKKRILLALEFPLLVIELRAHHSLHEDVGLIPGLTQWVKDLVLP